MPTDYYILDGDNASGKRFFEQLALEGILNLCH
jgi:hypothetical protein